MECRPCGRRMALVNVPKERVRPAWSAFDVDLNVEDSIDGQHVAKRDLERLRGVSRIVRVPKTHLGIADKNVGDVLQPNPKA